jgi:hypothetical protein
MADGANDQGKPAFLGGKDVLDPRAHPGAGGVAAGDVGRHLAAARLFALELRLETAALEQVEVGSRTVGSVGPHIAGGVVAVEHRTELATVIGRRVGDDIAPQQPVLAIDADMIFVAEHRHRDLRLPPVAGTRRRLALTPTLDGPASVAVDLRPPRRFPFGRHPATFDRLLHGPGQPWPARLDHRRVDDLPAHRQPALLAQQRVELCKQPFDDAGSGQLLAVEPNRLGVRHRVVQRQPDKPHERPPVAS